MVDKHGLPLKDVIASNVPRRLTSLSYTTAFTPTRTVTVTTPTVSVYQYKKRGFNMLTGQFEYWTSSTESSGPPSGNSLIDITILQKILISA